ncbi:ABC transporter ATP-binding protein [Thermoleophilum album]|uniref:ABC transporter ATP-binding protein n=1 Tax=Thermoleophilum album TaxID=29539 RepID=UPI00237CF033|nr:ABC transporter ATP-binding protein [Thermoleophilum album]WDT93577.1 ABC transporter ATP-binding protein [Thermoleophilum album]
MAEAGTVIAVRGLERAYGSVQALRGVDLEVRRGEVFAFLGPNGAGKTTTVEILEGYRARDGGEVAVLGEDPQRADRAWRARIGIVSQETSLDPFLTALETVAMFGRYYPNPADAKELLEWCGIAELAARRVGSLSGGERRRLDFAVALVGRPELLFLDEPTTGFDAAARREAWELVRGLRELGTTVFLTTHYLDEAEQLADRVAVIVAGRVVAEGTPRELAAMSERYRISFRLPSTDSGARPPLDGRWDGGRFELAVRDPRPALKTLIDWSLERGIELVDLDVRRPSLEEIYLELVGQEELVGRQGGE